MSRQSLFALHAAVRHHTEAGPAWTLIELLRSANGQPLLGPPVTPHDVFELHASMVDVLGSTSAWTLMELLREENGDRLPTGEPWPDAFAAGRARSR